MTDPAALTRREAETLHLVSHGYTDRQIATELDVRLSTVKGLIERRLLHRLDAANRAELVGHAYRLGLLAADCCARPRPLIPAQRAPLTKPVVDRAAVARARAVTVDDWVTRFTEDPAVFDRICEDIRVKYRASRGLDNG